MSVALFHGDESDDEEAMERNAFRIGSEEYLPEDLPVDILSKKVPLASLARFRSVSKRWKALINYLRFKKSSQIMLIDSRVYLVSINFLGAQDNVVNITSQFSLKDPLSSSSKQVNIREVFHCQGLLLCTTEDNRLVVWNPCLDETTWIKPRSYYERSDIFALAAVDGYLTKFRLFNGEIHKYAYSFFWQSVCFVYDKRRAKTLYVSFCAADDVDVWMANKIDSTGAMSWSKFITVKRVYNNNQWMFLTGMNYLVDEKNKVIVCPGKSLDSGRFLHIVGEDKCIQVDKHDAGSRCSLLLSYAPTLVSASDIL
ncbi:hypothetical protein F2Q68_00017182 [Brassica cretica]|uniref:Uncharacterized protein n=2 Tax=Brassica cretica TaxID=69181 RepID=A0A3N6QQJ2_BRACR|nr:hypothetical protein F2Q68_00017182 [Brassica cretica]KAF3607618.1 hypothetical protein DY000_02049800 [Brassica cretica]